MSRALDLMGASEVRIRVRADGAVIWVHAPDLVLRICKIEGPVIVDDDRLIDTPKSARGKCERARLIVARSSRGAQSGAQLPPPEARAAPFLLRTAFRRAAWVKAAILIVLDRFGSAWGASDLHRMIGATRQETFCALRTLERAGAVARAEKKRCQRQQYWRAIWREKGRGI